MLEISRAMPDPTLLPTARNVPILRPWRLTTAEILYHLPDHPGVLQSFVWQQLDQDPDYPALKRFLDFWRRDIEGTLHSVRVAATDLADARWRNADHLLRLH
jgi:uncharacterized protein Usg